MIFIWLLLLIIPVHADDTTIKELQLKVAKLEAYQKNMSIFITSDEVRIQKIEQRYKRRHKPMKILGGNQ